MQAENWKKVKGILDEVLLLETSERKDFLDKSGANAEILSEVESLLGFETESENLMRLSAVEFSKDFFDEDEQNPLVGQQIGNYKIVRELGTGGMGAVYLAERADGKFSQRVALKLLKREMNTSALRRRFQQEREILASLEHPNIARLLDAGTTDDKIPFLAMEYVEGLPIDDYCNRQKLDLNSRLDLFRKVCAAAGFAHRNLIVHRDLKPSNILVNDEGAPKLLDFGISKILSAEFEQLNSATVTKLGVMTPGYASPEQLQSKSVTTATDIYSLGVILYELLSGHRPFESKEGDLKEIYKAVLENEPPPPSALIETISKDFKEITNAKTEILAEKVSSGKTESNKIRHTNPQTVKLNSQSLRGDLDNIVLKSLRKEPERRYSSAENFSEDIERHQKGLPVTARPQTFSYRAEKFIKRHSFGVSAGVLVVLVLIGGVIATLWQARIAQAERVKAESRFKDVRKLANSYLFDVYPQIEKLEGSLKARETILKNALEYLDSLANEAGEDIELQRELATAYEKVGDVQGAVNTTNLGNINAGLESYLKAQKLRESAFAANPSNLEIKEELAQNYQIIAKTWWNNNETKSAEEYYEKSLKLRRELAAANPASIDPQNKLAVLLFDYGAIPLFNQQSKKAINLFDEALNIIQKLSTENPDNTDLKKTLARGLRASSQAKVLDSDFEGALQQLFQAVAINKELVAQFPDDYRLQRTVWMNDYRICEVYVQKHDGQKAVENCLKATGFNENVLKKEPADAVAQGDLANSYFNVARAYRYAENPSGSIEYGEKALEIMSKLSEKTPQNVDYKRNISVYQSEIANAYLKLNQPDKALEYLQKIQINLEEIIKVDKESTIQQYDLAFAHRLFGEAYFKKGEKAKAVENMGKAIAIIQKLKELNALKEADKNLIDELEKEKARYSL